MKKMKKKLFLFITCSFLFSSLIVFFAHQNIQLSEIIKKEEEAKKILKELKKSNLNQKDENEDYEEEIDDLPWLLNWKGATVSLAVCGLITVPIGKILPKGFSNCSIFVVETIIFVILFFGLSPFLLAIAKDKDRSYKKRYCLLWRDYWKPFVCFVLSVLFVGYLSVYDGHFFFLTTNCLQCLRNKQ